MNYVYVPEMPIFAVASLSLVKTPPAPQLYESALFLLVGLIFPLFCLLFTVVKCRNHLLF